MLETGAFIAEASAAGIGETPASTPCFVSSFSVAKRQAIRAAMTMSHERGMDRDEKSGK